MKDECRQKLFSKEYIVIRVHEKGKGRGDSEAWNKFGRVVVDEPRQETDFVQCLNEDCKLIKICKSSSGSRASLASHKCSVPKPSDFPPVSRETKSEIASHLADLTAETFAPFVLVEAEAFANLAELLIQIGHKHGPVPAKGLLPCARTIAARLQSNADKARNELVDKIRPALEDGLTSGTIDGWSDKLRHRKFIAHTVQHIDENWELQDNLIGIPNVHAESISHEVIEEAISLEKVKLNLDPGAKMHYVTDNGSDMVAAVAKSGNERSYCMDHCTNLIVKKAMEIQLTGTDMYGVRGGLIVFRVRSAVQYLLGCRKPSLKDLKSNLVRGPESTTGQRIFKSSIPMLRAAKSNFKEIAAALRREGRSDILGDVSKADIADVISVVTPVEALAKAESSGKMFLPSHVPKLKTYLTIKARDSPLKRELKEHIENELELMPLLILIKKLKGIVKYMKSSGLNDTLKGGTLKQEVDTRWMSLLHMIKSFFPTNSTVNDKIIEINTLLQERDRTQQLVTVNDIDNMLSIIPVLEAFETAIKRFEAEYAPTIQHVVPQLYILLDAVKVKSTDSIVIKKLKSRLETELDLKYNSNITMRNKVGYFLWPQFRSLPKFSEAEKLEVHEAVKLMIAERKAVLERRRTDDQPCDGDEEEEEVTAGDPSPKRRRVSDDEIEYIFLHDEASDGEENVMIELDLYLALKNSECKANSKQLLGWWKTKAKDFPLLSEVARMVLATPASSASSERKFSAAGLLLTARKNGLAPETIGNILLYHDFLLKRKRLREMRLSL